MGLLPGALFAVHKTPGCSLDEAMLQSLIGSLGDFTDVKFEFETGGDTGDFGVAFEADEDS